MDEESQLASSVQASKTTLEEAFATGTAILESMASNKDLLKVTLHVHAAANRIARGTENAEAHVGCAEYGRSVGIAASCHSQASNRRCTTDLWRHGERCYGLWFVTSSTVDCGDAVGDGFVLVGVDVT